MSSTTKTVCALVIVFAAYGIVGRMDYEDALRVAQAQEHAAVRLMCWRTDTGPVYGEPQPWPSPARALINAVQIDDELAPPDVRVLRCVVLED